MLRTKNLAISFGGVRACNDVSLTFETGSTTAVVGPNGAGKSTFIQLLAGVLSPDSGEIELEGHRITTVSVNRRCAMGIGRTFQTPRIFPGISIWESTLLGAHEGIDRERRAGWRAAKDAPGAHGHGEQIDADEHAASGSARQVSLRGRSARRALAEERAEQVLELFGDRLLPRRHDLTYSLSYANRRRVEIARVLAARPNILLLDEPTAGMNPTETLELTEILADLERSQPDLTVIVIEHKMDVVRTLAQRVVVMDAGRVIADGQPDEVLALDHVIQAYLGSPRTEEAA